MKKSSQNIMISYLSFASLFANLAAIISGFFLAKWLLPGTLGLYNSFNIIQSYLVLTHLGIATGLSRNFPFYIGKNDRETAVLCASVSQYWHFILSTIVFFLCVLAGVFFISIRKFELSAGCVLIGFSMFQALYINNYLKVLYRTHSDFFNLAHSVLINALVSLFSLPLIYYLGFYGLVARVALITLIDFIILWKWRPIVVKPKWDKNIWLTLFKTGMPIFAVGSIYGLWGPVQRTILFFLGGVSSLGLFSIATIVESSMKTLTSTISTVVYPQMTYKWAKGGTVESLVHLSLQPLVLICLLYVITIPIGWFFFPEILISFLPDYIGATKACQWMLVVGAVSIFEIFLDIFNVIENQKYRIVAFLINVCVSIFGIILSFNFYGYSLDIFPKASLVGLIAMLAFNVVVFKRIKNKTESD